MQPVGRETAAEWDRAAGPKEAHRAAGGGWR